MKKLSGYLLAVLALINLSSYNVEARFLPRNNLHLQDHRFASNGIDETKFNEIIDYVVKYFGPVVESHGAKLSVDKRWNDSTVNAYAEQNGNTWELHMFGGLARRPEITPDGFAMVVCHELGHHLAGYYFYGNGDWAAAEGESDYFATHVCAKVVWGKQAAFNRKFLARHSIQASSACDTAYPNTDDRALCYRTVESGISLAKLLAALGNDPTPKVETPDPSKVSNTNTAHPEAQCRLDTYVNGALCSQFFDKNIIPGKGRDGGSNSSDAEKEAFHYSCSNSGNFTVGLRPRCWFKPQTEAGTTVRKNRTASNRSTPRHF